MATSEERCQMVDPAALVERLRRERGIFLLREYIDTPLIELTTEHEGRLIADHGFAALVSYYCPRDPRLAAEGGGE